MRRNAEYCDSVHTIILSPLGTSFLNDVAVADSAVAAAAQPASKGPLGLIMKAIAACGPSSRRVTKKKKAAKKASASTAAAGGMSAPETRAVRRLLSPPSYGSLVAPSIHVILEEARAASPALTSRASMSSLYTSSVGSAYSRSSTPSHDPAVPHMAQHPYASSNY